MDRSGGWRAGCGKPETEVRVEVRSMKCLKGRGKCCWVTRGGQSGVRGRKLSVERREWEGCGEGLSSSKY